MGIFCSRVGKMDVESGDIKFRCILEQRLGHDLAFGERSRRISDISLHIILLRIFPDGSGLTKDGAIVFVFFAPELGKWGSSWEDWNIVKKTKIEVLGMKFSIMEIVPTLDDDVFKLSRPPNFHMEQESER